MFPFVAPAAPTNSQQLSVALLFWIVRERALVVRGDRGQHGLERVAGCDDHRRIRGLRDGLRKRRPARQHQYEKQWGDQLAHLIPH